LGWPDYFILGVIILSSLVGVFRGFIKEVFSLVVWAVAFFVAWHFSGDVADLLSNAVTLPSARTAMGFAGLFIATLLVGGLINFLLGKLVETTGLSGTDRLLGGLFGAVRGLALVVALLLVCGFTPIPQDPWWRDSATIQRLMPLVERAAQLLPESVTEHLDFSPEPGDASPEEPAEEVQA
jgi:membrane protein required for colicin V production